MLKISITILTLLSIVALNYNMIRYGHYHRLLNGYLVYHAHYNNMDSQGSTTGDSHSHSSAELVQLEQITNSFFLVLALFLASMLAFISFNILHRKINNFKYQIFKSSKQLRAPPLPLFSN